ncbi:MAG: hypothetical protein V8R14_08410, partial [Clostridia bacterium]
MLWPFVQFSYCLSEDIYENFQIVGAPAYTEKDQADAKEIQKSMGCDVTGYDGFSRTAPGVESACDGRVGVQLVRAAGIFQRRPQSVGRMLRSQLGGMQAGRIGKRG